MRDEHRGRRTGHAYHIVMLSIPNAVITKAFCGLRGAHTFFETLRDITALYNTGKIENGEGNGHGSYIGWASLLNQWVGRRLNCMQKSIFSEIQFLTQ